MRMEIIQRIGYGVYMFISVKRFFFNKLLDLLPSSCFGYRRFILKLMGVRTAKSTKVNEGFRVYGPGSVVIGENVWIGKNCTLYTAGSAGISIGKNCDIGPECCFNCQSHNIGTEERRAGSCIMHDIRLENGIWLGMRSAVFCGSIGSGAVIGACSVVLQDVPANVLCAGNPAQIKKSLL